ncbi:hypothetical protein C0033_06995 [Clostridium sp. chh4-2]|nr:hypothetical protein C0033_06995 [Clostridium sp. chh4-2]
MHWKRNDLLYNESEVMHMRRIIAAAIVKGEKILIAKRSYGSLADYWEFPGGKVEDNESDESCLKREIMEELKVNLKMEKFLGEQRFCVEDKEYIMALYKAALLDDNFQLSVHREIAWVEKGQILKYKLAPVDELLVHQGCLEELE